MRIKLLLITANYAPEPVGIGKYNGEMIRWLTEQGYHCTVLTTYPYYPQWRVQAPYRRRRFWYSKEKGTPTAAGGQVTVLRCPQYTPSAPSGKRRILQELTFVLAAFWRMLWLVPGKKFDVVMTVAPPFHLGLLGVVYRWLRGGHCLHHVQDLQIEAARDLGMIRHAGLLNFLFRLERYMLRHTHVVSSISEGMMQKIRDKVVHDMVVYFPNWANIRSFYPLDNREELKREFGFAASDKIVLYAGAIGEKQGLEAILHAAHAFREQRGLWFLVCGSGPYRMLLEAQALAMGLSNIVFLETQPPEQFNRFLNMADVHLVIQKMSVSDLVMPSKLTTILAVGGVAVVTANPGTSLYELVHRYGIGLVVPAENQEALNEGIYRAIYQEQRHIIRKACAYARENLAIDEIMRRYEAVAFKVLGEEGYASASGLRRLL